MGETSAVGSTGQQRCTFRTDTRLGLEGRVQSRFQDEDVVGRRQVDADGASSHGEEEDGRGRVVLERVDRLLHKSGGEAPFDLPPVG